MAATIQAIKGTRDTLPAESHKNQYIERTALDTAAAFGFREMRTPVFEYTELFDRGVGETTDVVQKEMYTFTDKGDRSVTLRPEGTAGAVRAFLEHGLFNEPLPQKLCYLTSCYRYEKPQAGRLREFHQFGVECFGAASAAQDAELISLADSFFAALGLSDYTLEINSIGCPTCRAAYSNALRAYFEDKKDRLCDTCLTRLDRNPMRILDCKVPDCQAIAADAPAMLDYLCDDCRAHFENLKGYLTALGISYEVNPRIVRGLDYYTRTVFEFVSHHPQTQGLVLCGGGRYDGLVEELGGSPMPACGFAVGLERLQMAMDAVGAPFPEAPPCNLALVTAGEAALLKAMALAADLRAEGYSVTVDTVGRSIKAQMKYANKIGAQYTAVIGDNELEAGTVKLKNMETSDETELPLDTFCEGFSDVLMRRLTDAVAGADFGSLTQPDIDRLLGGRG